ncbi:MAG TPA: CDP-alcohol phosphatidyltransferase family protein [Thermodesulfovibrionales bacterium]|nr:CDP-alcohol phosphatidyltransferase family protein [Thermodesulfovibrionales bacterium]
MLSAKLGHFLDTPLSQIAKKIPLSPNALTIVGFLITAVAAFMIPKNIRLGGILILIGGIFDVFDGVVARTRGQITHFGAFLDSVLDRYSDAFLFLAISLYFVEKGNLTGAYLSLGTLVGAFLISYARARAEGLGKSCYTGIMERPERIILLAVAAITGWLLPVLWIMLFLTHITVLQRVYHVWKILR